jgi:hypothetical protein
LKHKQFEWSTEAREAFDSLKKAMSSTPVLALLNFDQLFVIETDACDMGVGAVLSQNGQPIAFFNKAVSIANQKVSTYEKEFLVVLMAIDKWRSYLARQPFLSVTDHKSLCYLQDQSLSTKMQRKAMVKLAGLQFKLQYKRGPDNKVADALSRLGHNFAIQSTFVVVPVWLQEITNSYAVDPAAHKVLHELAVKSPNADGYSLSQGLIKFKKRIWIASNSALQTKIISAFHASAIGGHSGIQATYKIINKLFCWKGLKQDVTSFVQQCVCQQTKHENCKTPGLLNPLPIPENAWQDLSMDFI